MGNMKGDYHIKRFLFKYYALISITVFVVSMPVAILKWKIFAAIVAGAFAFAFSVQKQKLEETKLFKDLFEHFNKRYDQMNDDLNHIYQQPPHLRLTDDERRKLFKYFNLCGEECLYFEKGFIYPEVWRAWENAMKFFQKNPRIKNLWDEELKNNESYYGLTF